MSEHYGRRRSRDLDETVVLPAATAKRADLDQTVLLPRQPAADDTVVVGLDATTVLPRVPAGAGPEADGTHDQRPSAAAPLQWLSALGAAPAILAISACGVLLIALAYTGGRTGAPWAGVAYWAAQFVIFAPVAVRVFSARLRGDAEAFTLVIGLAVHQYLQKWLYSPDQFRFPDELQHWAGTNTLLETGRLFQPNLSLPPAVHFPGLEEMAAALSALTTLPVTTSGLLVAAVTHLIFVGGLFILIRVAGGTPQLAAATCVLYATALHYLFFDSMFVYQTGALPFLILVVWAARTCRDGDLRQHAPHLVVAVVAILAVTITHHVTALVMVGTLGLFTACELIWDRRRRWRSAVLFGAAIVIVAGWFVLVAPELLDYLGSPIRDVAGSLPSVVDPAEAGAGGGGGGVATPGRPLWQLAIQAAGLGLLLVLFVREAWPAVRAPRRLDPWRAALVLGSAAFFATTAAALVGGQGPELAGRASTYVYVPMAVLAAAGVMRLRSDLAAASPRWSAIREHRYAAAAPALVGSMLALVLMAGARVGGWPPYAIRLPGQFLVSGFERSIDDQAITAAVWAGNWLGPGNRVAADQTGAILVSTYGGQDPVAEAATLYYSAQWSLDNAVLVDSLAISYLWVDVRLTTQIPFDGGPYFAADPLAGQHTEPIPLENLNKFDSVPGVSRLYDSGTIRIYDVRSL